jgi:acetylornithine deacetylase/succinyl-diaminopimelate desuccinylase-like protein
MKRHGSATLCGLGPMGGGAHSPDEYIELDTIVTRAQALALTILRVGADATSHATTDHRA